MYAFMFDLVLDLFLAAAPLHRCRSLVWRECVYVRGMEHITALVLSILARDRCR